VYNIRKKERKKAIAAYSKARISRNCWFQGQTDISDSVSFPLLSPSAAILNLMSKRIRDEEELERAGGDLSALDPL